MATLKEAVESGRRWRYCYGSRRVLTSWLGPGYSCGDLRIHVDVRDALSKDFEIEPEPEKPREWWLHFHQTKLGDDSYQRWFHKRQCACCIRVHDADACDRLRGK